MLTAEQQEIRGLAREFAERSIRPHSAHWDESGELGEGIFGDLSELGFLGMRVPEEFGGLGLDTVTYVAALEALAWGDASVALSVQIHSGPAVDLLLGHGSQAQKERWLPAMAAGECVAAFALSEEGSGSDPGSLETRARRVGDGWSISGTKRWVTNGDRAGMAVVFARTGEENEIGAFLVPREAEGYEVLDREKTLGFAASETVTVRFSDVQVGPEALLGDPGRGLAFALQALEIGRLGVAALALGIADAALEHALRYSGERVQFGRPIGHFGAIQEKLAGMVSRIHSARQTVLAAAARRDGPSPADGLSLAAEAAVAKLVATESAVWVADEAIQIFGGYGYMREYPVEKLLRDAKGTEIFEGTSEVLRWLVARVLLGVQSGT
jgi:alkylation response protein AidB-like acyl-CoA dehydrogenase